MRQHRQTIPAVAIALERDADLHSGKALVERAAEIIDYLAGRGFEIVPKVEVVAPGVDLVIDIIREEVIAAYDAGQDGRVCLFSEVAARIVRDIGLKGFEIVPEVLDEPAYEPDEARLRFDPAMRLPDAIDPRSMSGPDVYGIIDRHERTLERPPMQPLPLVVERLGRIRAEEAAAPGMGR